MPLRSASPAVRRWIAWAVLFLAHLLVLGYFVRPDALTTGPIVGGDWDMHVQQSMRAVDAWWSGYHTWGYDPQMLAGSLSGTIFDADNKMHELVVVLLATAGVSPDVGFNAFIVIAHASVPVVLYGAARLFGVSRLGATIAGVLGSLLWFFDSAIHWGWWAGSLSWAFGAALAVLPVALFHRWREARAARWLVATAAALSATLLVHPYTFFVMVAPMSVVYWSAAKRGMTVVEHFEVVATGVVAFVANLWWLVVALRFWSYIQDSAFLGATSIAHLLWDFVGYLDDPEVTGHTSTRTSFRFFTLTAAAIGAWRWRRDRDPRTTVLVTAFGLPFALTYVGGHLGFVRQVQPLRFIFSAAFFATIVAGAELARLSRNWRELVRTSDVAVVVALALVVAVPKLLLDVGHYFPKWLPVPREVVGEPRYPVGNPRAGAEAESERPDYAHHAITDEEWEIIDFVRRHDDGSARWLVEWSVLGERLAWSTKAQILGGFPYFNMAHSDANWFRTVGAKRDAKNFEAYLDTYAVGWLIRTWPGVEELDRPDLFEHVGLVGGHQVYRRRVAPSFVIDGEAKVRASFNRVRVEGSEGGSLVLRYHYLDTLVCNPGCTLRREPMPTDRVGFIRVEGAPRNFEIVNAY